jgi:hypothetical protein
LRNSDITVEMWDFRIRRYTLMPFKNEKWSIKTIGKRLSRERIFCLFIWVCETLDVFPQIDKDLPKDKNVLCPILRNIFKLCHSHPSTGKGFCGLFLQWCLANGILEMWTSSISFGKEKQKSIDDHFRRFGSTKYNGFGEFCFDFC